MTCVTVTGGPLIPSRSQIRSSQERLLAVVTSGAVLDIREQRPVLDVEQRPKPGVPADHVGPTREPIVLPGLVDTEPEAMRREGADLVLPHRGMDDVRTDRPDVDGLGRAVRAGVLGEAHLEAPVERDGDPDVQLDRAPSP